MVYLADHEAQTGGTSVKGVEVGLSLLALVGGIISVREPATNMKDTRPSTSTRVGILQYLEAQYIE